MPLKKASKGSSKKVKRKIASSNIAEMHHGKTYAKTMRKYGKAIANRQAIAAGMHAAGLSKSKRSTKKKKG